MADRGIDFRSRAAKGPANPASDDDRGLHRRVQELERMREQYELEAAAFEDLDRLYRGLADSGAFLYAFVDVRGTFLFMNRGMQLFLGQDPEGGAPETLLSRCPFGQIEAMRGLLHDAMGGPVAAVVPLARPDGDGRGIFSDGRSGRTRAAGHRGGRDGVGEPPGATGARMEARRVEPRSGLLSGIALLRRRSAGHAALRLSGVQRPRPAGPGPSLRGGEALPPASIEDGQVPSRGLDGGCAGADQRRGDRRTPQRGGPALELHGGAS